MEKKNIDEQWCEEARSSELATKPTNPDDLLTPQEVAAWTKLKTQTLALWRSRGQHLNYCKLGSAARYRRGEVEKWLKEREIKVH